MEVSTGAVAIEGRESRRVFPSLSSLLPAAVLTKKGRGFLFPNGQRIAEREEETLPLLLSFPFFAERTQNRKGGSLFLLPHKRSERAQEEKGRLEALKSYIADGKRKEGRGRGKRGGKLKKPEREKKNEERRRWKIENCSFYDPEKGRFLSAGKERSGGRKGKKKIESPTLPSYAWAQGRGKIGKGGGKRRPSLLNFTLRGE